MEGGPWDSSVKNRGLFPVHKKDLVRISADYENWMREFASSSGFPLLDDPEKRRDQFMEPYFASAQPDQIVGVIKAREPALILTAIGNAGKSTHLETALRWVNQYNYYLQDRDFGPMFVRICPYFPFAARLCSEPARLDRQSAAPGWNYISTTG